MKVEALRDVNDYKKGDVFEMHADVAKRWIYHGLVKKIRFKRKMATTPMNRMAEGGTNK